MPTTPPPRTAYASGCCTAPTCYTATPLLAWWRRTQPVHRNGSDRGRGACDCQCAAGGYCASDSSLARRLGVSRTTLWRWSHRGLTDREADRAASTLGLHPSALWRDW